MNTRDKFQIGQRVKMSPRAVSAMPPDRGASTSGEVVGYGRDSTLVRVRRDGRKTADTWHMDLWEREP